LRIPFDEFDHPRNYLTKLLRYPKVYDNVNSLSHSGDFVRACLDLWQRRAPFGLYNMTNPGFVTARQVTARLREALRLQREFVYWTSDEEFYREAALTPRSNCVLDVSKLLATGVQLRPVEEAIAQSLRDWVAA
jgi:UDP-glucose 4,6-dehydratase